MISAGTFAHLMPPSAGMTDFLPPIDDPFTVGIAKMLLPLAKMRCGLDIKISDRCRQIINDMRDKNAVLMINHSDRLDPLCACALARECDDNFYFIASREQFDRQFGFAGWTLQHLGAYSVLRGTNVETASAKKTVQILVEGKHRLAQFPEGDVTGRDDKIFPLKEDEVRNLFEAQRQLVDSTQASILVVPVAMYYSVRHDSIRPMQDCLQKIEAALSLSTMDTINLSFEQRIKRTVSSFISHIENLYGLHLQQRQSLSAELHELSRKITIRTAKATGVHFDEDLDDAILLYDVRAELRSKSSICPQGNCNFTKNLLKEEQIKRKMFVKDLDRCEQLLILASTLESEKFTPEIAWRVLDRLEMEVLGKTTAKGHRTAYIDAAPAIDLKPIYADFVSNQNSGIKRLDERVRNEIYRVSQELQAQKQLALIP